MKTGNLLAAAAIISAAVIFNGCSTYNYTRNEYFGYSKPKTSEVGKTAKILKDTIIPKQVEDNYISVSDTSAYQSSIPEENYSGSQQVYSESYIGDNGETVNNYYFYDSEPVFVPGYYTGLDWLFDDCFFYPRHYYHRNSYWGHPWRSGFSFYIGYTGWDSPWWDPWWYYYPMPVAMPYNYWYYPYSYGYYPYYYGYNYYTPYWNYPYYGSYWGWGYGSPYHHNNSNDSKWNNSRRTFGPGRTMMSDNEGYGTPTGVERKSTRTGAIIDKNSTGSGGIRIGGTSNQASNPEAGNTGRKVTGITSSEANNPRKSERITNAAGTTDNPSNTGKNIPETNGKSEENNSRSSSKIIKNFEPDNSSGGSNTSGSTNAQSSSGSNESSRVIRSSEPTNTSTRSSSGASTSIPATSGTQSQPNNSGSKRIKSDQSGLNSENVSGTGKLNIQTSLSKSEAAKQVNPISNNVKSTTYKQSKNAKNTAGYYRKLNVERNNGNNYRERSRSSNSESEGGFFNRLFGGNSSSDNKGNSRSSGNSERSGQSYSQPSSNNRSSSSSSSSRSSSQSSSSSSSSSSNSGSNRGSHRVK